MKKDKKIITNKRRSFIKKAGLLTLGAAGATAIKAPYAYSASNPIKWRLQTYSGAPLGALLEPDPPSVHNRFKMETGFIIS